MELVTVWDKEGKPHRMSHANARDLTKFAGWTNTPPVVLEAAEKVTEALKAAEAAAEQELNAKALREAQELAEKRAAEIAAAAAVAAAAAAKSVEESEQKQEEAEAVTDPEKMSVDQLKELATNLGVDVDDRWGKRRLLEEIKKAAAKGE